MLRLSITCGDINGIGPEISIKTINKINKPGRRILFFCPANVFEKNSAIVKPEFEFHIVKKIDHSNTISDKVTIVDLGKSKINYGFSSAAAGKTAFDAIQKAHRSIIENLSDAVITAPLSKLSLQKAGINYPGQTEIFAELSGSKNYLMVFLSSNMIGGLVSIHEPIKHVPALISKSRLRNSIKILNDMLVNDLNVSRPNIAVLGLNPHAGEMGKIGTEEQGIIKPVIEEMAVNMKVGGPFVPDAFFAAKNFNKYDAVLGMYHDQLLIPFKMMNFNKGVNYTAGLPIVRTSPDHGTAFDKAGLGIADEMSMMEAVRWAEKIVRNRKKLYAKKIL